MTLRRKAGAHLPNNLKSLLIRIKNSGRARLYNEFIRNIEAGEILVTPPGLHGHYWLDVRSHLFKRIVLAGSYEPDVASFLSSNISDDFIDIGANVGFYSIHIGNQLSTGARVLALEPNTKAFSRLARNIKNNDMEDKIIALEKAASSTKRTLSLHTIDGLEEYSSVKDMSHPGVKDHEASIVQVEALPLDELVSDHKLSPGLVKIDAEGAELDVLSGMHETLQQYSPTIVCEINADPTGTTAKNISNLFTQHKYRLFSLDGTPTTLDPIKSCEIVARRD